MGELLEALHYAHQAGAIHRDIKPANVMVDTKGHIKLRRFRRGARQRSRRRGARRRASARSSARRRYMSPEQTQGQTIDHRTDLFSAGIVFYQLLHRAEAVPGRALAGAGEEDHPGRPGLAVHRSSRFQRPSTASSPGAGEGDLISGYQTAREIQRRPRSDLAAGSDPEAPAIARPRRRSPSAARVGVGQLRWRRSGQGILGRVGDGQRRDLDDVKLSPRVTVPGLAHSPSRR